jgi:hypothetical protein
MLGMQYVYRVRIGTETKVEPSLSSAEPLQFTRAPQVCSVNHSTETLVRCGVELLNSTMVASGDLVNGISHFFPDSLGSMRGSLNLVYFECHGGFCPAKSGSSCPLLKQGTSNTLT